MVEMYADLLLCTDEISFYKCFYSCKIRDLRSGEFSSYSDSNNDFLCGISQNKGSKLLMFA
jgi:hypothetical protein